MNELLGWVSGVLLAVLANWQIGLWHQINNRKKRTDALRVLENRGLTPPSLPGHSWCGKQRVSVIRD